MKNRSVVLILVSISLSLVSPLIAEGKDAKQTPLERSMESAQLFFEQGKFLKAERAWIKAQTELKKGDPDERLASVWIKLGETYSKESKFPLAADAFKQSIEVSKVISKDPLEAQNKLQELDSIYRTINLQGFDETATNFAQHVGALDACALNQEDKHHIDINLGKRFQEKVTDLASTFMPKNADGTPQDVPEIPGSKDAPQVKSLRLDKKIAFDLKRGDDGLLRLSNIEGIFFDVGLWAKLKELVMLNTNPDSPAVEITAGAFGVEKKVKADLPKNVFTRLKEGIDKFDPFAAKPNNISAEKPDTSVSASTPIATPTPTPAPVNGTIGTEASTTDASSTQATPADTQNPTMQLR